MLQIFVILYTWGSPRTIEEYVQESGRCGRDNEQATATLYYSQSHLAGSSHLVKAYCENTNTCRRQLLLAVFDESSCQQPNPVHLCCDICHHSCVCIECGAISVNNHKAYVSVEEVLPETTPEQKVEIKHRLINLRSLHVQSNNPLLFGMDIATGLTDTIIDVISTHGSYYTEDKLIGMGIDVDIATDIISIVSNIM